MKKLYLASLLALAAACAPADKPAVPPPAPMPAGAWKTTPGSYAVLNTDKGRIVVRLFEDRAPNTVANFVGLAEGTKEYRDPRDDKPRKGRYYDGTKFFRIIPGFMIQGGDPTNTGTGSPGYRFDDEVASGLKFDRAGLLAMANSGLGPDGHGSNGSQFFITDRPRNGVDLPSHLNGHHTIFGDVVEGLDVVSAIADLPTEGDHALRPATVKSVEIARVPAAAPAGGVK